VCDGVEDWFRIAVAAGARMEVLVQFRHQDGDLDVELYQADGTTRIASSAGTSDSESVVYKATAAADVLLKVFGYNGAANTYSVTVAFQGDVAPGCQEDGPTATARTAAAAAPVQAGTHPLVVCGGEDWLSYASASGRFTVRAEFAHAQGDLDLEVYDAAGQTQIGKSTGTGNTEQVVVNRTAGTYAIRVYGYSGAQNAYALSITEN
jgi:hypothetical protein